MLSFSKNTVLEVEDRSSEINVLMTDFRKCIEIILTLKHAKV